MKVTAALVLVGLAHLGSCQYVYNQKPTSTAERLGASAFADIKNLEAIATQFFNNMCHQAGRGDNCFKYVDLNG